MESSIKNIEIIGIEAAVPCNEVDNALYISQIANRRIKKQIELTGVKKRRVTVGEQKASDLAAEAAKKLMKKIKTSIMHLSEEPYLYMRIDTSNNSHNNFRRIVVNNYVILYLVSEANHTVYISHMYYGKRDYM